MPELQALYAARRDDGLRVVAVNLGETREAAQTWVDAFGLSFDIALDTNGRVAALYALRGQPSTYVVAPDGVITHIFYGATTRAALEAALTQ
jgi:peroxiredoxin